MVWQTIPDDRRSIAESPTGELRPMARYSAVQWHYAKRAEAHFLAEATEFIQ